MVLRGKYPKGKQHPTPDLMEWGVAIRTLELAVDRDRSLFRRQLGNLPDCASYYVAAEVRQDRSNRATNFVTAEVRHDRSDRARHRVGAELNVDVINSGRGAAEG